MWQLNFRLVLYFCIAPVLVLCILFVTSAYVVLYRETLRHRKMIKTHQLPQGEVERFTKENKVLKTTVNCNCNWCRRCLLFASWGLYHSPHLWRVSG